MDNKSEKNKELFWIIFNSLAMLSCLVALIICLIKNCSFRGYPKFYLYACKFILCSMSYERIFEIERKQMKIRKMK